MQINRLFGIVYILLDKKRATAKELAEHFEVSVRTILRDIETLSAAWGNYDLRSIMENTVNMFEKYIKTSLATDTVNRIINDVDFLEAIDKIYSPSDWFGEILEEKIKKLPLIFVLRGLSACRINIKWIIVKKLLIYFA
ncbi:hypothetical protein bsdtw1_01574 [Clostridium fungisolvens]|uniref:Helix-turn-helix type 11 domain-containing protein n=1 Tax=Clostridium fungisolvens TaxID=1604897 RepID=A0A6V8SE36_9CLOT|nr:hypothetical protein bsdtw1_01574 [Clostridium fungisolvens]